MTAENKHRAKRRKAYIRCLFKMKIKMYAHQFIYRLRYMLFLLLNIVFCGSQRRESARQVTNDRLIGSSQNLILF